MRSQYMYYEGKDGSNYVNIMKGWEQHLLVDDQFDASWKEHGREESNRV